MTKLEFLTETQTEMLAGGNDAGWGFPALFSTKSSSMDINNLISQSNVGSAWASTAAAGAGGGSGYGSFWRMPKGGGAGSDATNIQKNILKLDNFGFSIVL